MSIRSFESGAAAAAEGVRAARAERLPDVGVTVSASFLGDGRLWDRSFGEGMKVDIPHFGNNFALEAQQVVYAGGAVRSGIRMAELEQRDAETSLERNRQIYVSCCWATTLTSTRQTTVSACCARIWR